MPLIRNFVRVITYPHIIISSIVVFSLNYLQMFGFVALGNDTGKWDVRYRTLASALVRAGDLPLWLPNGGNGFPQLSLYWGALVANPVGTVIGLFRPYDQISLGIETLLWRAIGFAGAYGFARSFARQPIGAVAVASAYVGSGLMAWASLSYPVLIGLMLAPWLLTSGMWLINAQTGREWKRGVGSMGLTYAAMVWCGYPGAWIMAPVLGGPLLLAVASRTSGALSRLVAGSALAAVAAVAMIGILISETMSLPIFAFSGSFRQETADMRDGLLRLVDLFGLVFPLPSVIPGLSPAVSQPIFFGILNIIIISIHLAHSIYTKALYITVPISGILLSSTLNVSIVDHPLYGVWRTDGVLQSVARETLYSCLFVFTIWSMLSILRDQTIRVKNLLLIYGLCIILVASDWSLANILRTYVPPFQLVRYNFLYSWISILLGATSSWIILEEWFLKSERNTVRMPSPTAIRRGVASVLCLLALVVIAVIPTPDARGAGFPETGLLSIGVPQVAWQLLIYTMIVFMISFLYLYIRRRVPVQTALIAFALGSLGGLLIFHVGLQAWNVDSHPSLDMRSNFLVFWALSFPVSLAFIILLFPKIVHYSKNIYIFACVLICEILLTAPSYFSDNPNLGPPHPTWPHTPQFPARVIELFEPAAGTRGDYRRDFWSLFDSTISPPPAVTRLQNAWGTMSDRWVHFPEYWSSTGAGGDRWVTRGSLGVEGAGQDAPRAPLRDVLQHTQTKASREAFEEAPPRTAVSLQACEGVRPGPVASGHVSLLLATRVVVGFRSDCARLLVFTDSWAPGWRADIDGEPVPVLRINGAYRGAMVPAGEHVLTWHYVPRYFWELLALFAASALSCVALVLAPPWLTAPARWMRFNGWMRDWHRPTRYTESDGQETTASETGQVLEGFAARDMTAIARTITHTVLLVLACSAASIAAFDSLIDGSRAVFIFAVLRTALISTTTAILLAMVAPRRPMVAVITAAIIVSPMLIVQATRHVASAGIPDPTVLVIDTNTGRLPPDWLPAVVAPDRTAGIGIRLEVRSISPVISIPLSDLNSIQLPFWARPLGGLRYGSVDVGWISTIERTGPYLAVFQIGRFSIQAAKGGMLITSPRDGDVTASFIAMSDQRISERGKWQFVSDGATGLLTLDASTIWQGKTGSLVSNVIFGDASRDVEHAGAVTLERIEVRQRAVNQRDRVSLE